MDKTDVFLLLRELATRQGDLIDLQALRRQAPALSPRALHSRIGVLAEALDIRNAADSKVAAALLATLSSLGDGLRFHRAKLLEALRSHQAATQSRDALADFEHRVRKMLAWETGAEGMWARELGLEQLIRRWGRTLLESPAWNRIESPVPGIADLPLQDTWVDLTLRQFDPSREGTMVGLETAAWSELEFDRPDSGVTPREMLLGVRGLTVVMGSPGAGKSTLMKWLARYVVARDDCPFGIPVFVSLRQFAKEKAKHPRLSLLEHFLVGRGINSAATLSAWSLFAEGLLQAERHEMLLWLLDGWDEVPPDMRDTVLSEIQSFLPAPVILTTRYSAGPMRLPADRFFEIQGLKHAAALRLADRWLNQTGRGAYYAAIEIGLEESQELRRMARSPFLLTLICALSSTPDASGTAPGFLPRSRGAILGGTLESIYAQHNQDVKQLEKFSRKDIAQIARFAFWLLSEAEEAPRYLFDDSDYATAGGTADRFDTLLVPSRLIAHPSVNTEDFQFLHSSFQEFLAARHLAALPKSMPDWGSLILDSSWKEVLRFLAEDLREDSPAWEALWSAVRAAARNLDPFGLVVARIALLLDASGQPQGGRLLLGFDVRPHLWAAIKQFADQVPSQPLQAYLDLDPQDFARRVLDDRISVGRNTVLVAFLQRVSIFDLEPLFDDDRYRRVLILPEVAAFCPDLPDYLFKQADEELEQASEALSRQLASGLLAADMVRARTTFWKMIDDGMVESAAAAVDLLDRRPKGEVLDLLLEIAQSERVDDVTRSAAVRQMGQHESRQAYRALMAFVASVSPEDARLHAILGNLSGHLLIQADIDLVTEMLSHPDPLTRSAVVDLLLSTRQPDTSQRLVFHLCQESNGDVRRSIWSALEDLADAGTLKHVWQLQEQKAVRSGEWTLWFNAVLASAQKWQLRRAGANGIATDSLQSEVREWARRALVHGIKSSATQRERDSLAALLDYPFILGSSALTDLLDVAQSNAVPGPMRAAAIRALSSVGGQGAIEAARRLATVGRRSAAERKAACETLGELSPVALAELDSPEAVRTKAALAYRREILFLSQRQTLDASGRDMNRQSKAAGVSGLTWPFQADIALFTALKEEFAVLKEMLARRGGISWSSEDDATRAFTFWGGKMTSPSGPLSIVAVCAHQMAPTRAANLASTLVDRFSPRAVVVIGIAGSLTDDLRLGDVLVPNEASSYLENSAIKDGRRSFRFELSGNHFEASQHLLNQTRQVAERHPRDYRKWLLRCKQRARRRLGTKLDAALEAATARPMPQLMAGDHHLATGPAVGKSTQFARWLLEHDRKITALEMETAAVFDAVATQVEPCRKLAIRGVSDFADRRKSLVEKEFKGAFRSISMANAVDLFILLVQTGAFAPPR